MLKLYAILIFGAWITITQCNRLYKDKTIVETAETDSRRPLWNIAHMVNALYQVDYYVKLGANAIEFDVSFDSQGTAKYTFHGVPCDCFRTCTKSEDIVTFIKYLRETTTPNSTSYLNNLVLLQADMKLSGIENQARSRAGTDFAQKLIEHYWDKGNSKARAYILLSVPSVEYANFITAFYHELGKQGLDKYKEMVGIDFSGNEDLGVTNRVVQTLDIGDHVWQGDGITNCLTRGITRLSQAIVERDRSPTTYIKKVYWWTVDKMSTMRMVLNLGVDGMITNKPWNLLDVLKESDFSGRFRLATISDNPWVKFKAATMSDLTHDFVKGDNIVPDSEIVLHNCCK